MVTAERFFEFLSGILFAPPNIVEQLARQMGFFVAGDRHGFPLLVRPAFEAPAVIAGLDDVAVVGQAIEQCSRHLGITEDARPLPEREVRGDDD